MAITHTLWDDVLVEASAFTITAGEELVIATSPEITNAIGFNSCKVTLRFDQFTAAASGLGSYRIGVHTEFEEGPDVWAISPLYMFSTMRKDDTAPNRILIMQPNMDTFSLGVDDVMAPVSEEVCRVSRVQGALPDGKFRVCVTLLEATPGGAAAWESFRLTGEMEQYDV